MMYTILFGEPDKRTRKYIKHADFEGGDNCVAILNAIAKESTNAGDICDDFSDDAIRLVINMYKSIPKARRKQS